MKKIILISIISLIGFGFYGCTTAYKTVTVYTTDTVTGKPIKKVTKFYDTQTTYYNNVSPYPYYYANPYWYGGWYGGWGSPYYGNNYYFNSNYFYITEKICLIIKILPCCEPKV